MIVNQKLNFVSEKLYCHIVIPPIITVHSHIASPIMVIPRIASCSALPQFSQTFAYREAYACILVILNTAEPHSQNRLFEAFLLLMMAARHIDL